jgi:hypothetical protein
MWLRTTANYDLWTLDAANEYTTFIFSKDFRNAIFTLIIASSFSWTIKFYSSNSETRPTFASSASATNEYTTVEVINTADGTDILKWGTGFVATGSSDGILQYEVNENNNTWIWVKMTARSAWSVSIKLDLSDNQ